MFTKKFVAVLWSYLTKSLHTEYVCGLENLGAIVYLLTPMSQLTARAPLWSHYRSHQLMEVRLPQRGSSVATVTQKISSRLQCLLLLTFSPSYPCQEHTMLKDNLIANAFYHQPDTKLFIDTHWQINYRLLQQIRLTVSFGVRTE